MAYRLETQNIVPGGLNLLLPGDAEINRQAGESLDLQDWWAGAEGKLEQAPQFGSNMIAGFGPVDSLCVTGSRIYYGGAGSLGQIGRGIIDTGYDGYPLGMIAYQGYCWITNRAKQRKDDGTTTPSDWTLAAPAAPTLTDGGNFSSGTDGLRALEYTYYITWVSTLGETNPSPPATITPALDGSSVVITRPSIPAAMIGWNVYRGVPPAGGSMPEGGAAAPYLVNTWGPLLPIANSLSDTCQAGANTDDTGLLRYGQIMEADHDPAPAARIMANQTFNGRIVVANSAAHKNRIWYTQPLEPAFFRGSTNEVGGDWVDVGTDSDDEILAITVRQGMCIIYRAKSIWRHLGDFGADNAVMEPAVPDIGVVGPRGVVSTSLGDYFIGNDGMYKFNNDWADKLSLKVEPVFLGKPTENLVTLGPAYRSQMAIGHRGGRFWITYPNTGGSGGSCLIYHQPTQRWFNAGGYWLAYLDTGTQFLAGGPGVFALETSYAAGNTSLAFQSQYFDAGLPDREKTWADLVLSHNTRGVTMTIFIRTNKNATVNDSFTLATFSSTAITKSVIPLVYPSDYVVVPLRGKPIRSFTLSVRITGAGGTSPIVIETPILLHYYVEARRGKTFDTGPTNHGLEGVGSIDQVELDIDSADVVTLVISSDIPGGVLVDRTSGGLAIAPSTGRQILRTALANPVNGRLFRHRMSSAADFGLYGFKVRILPIGVYLDGTNPSGDFWYTLPLSPGE